MLQLENGKYTTRSRSVVIDNKDPNKRGRIRVKHPILGETVWINYLKTPGFFDVPKIGDIVYLECDCGYDTHPVAWGNIVKGKDGDLDIPEQFQRVDPTNRGFYTPEGHLVELDDGETPLKTGKGIRITTSGGIKIHALEGNPTESQVLISMPGGLNVTADGFSDSLTVSTNFGDSLELSRDNGFQISTPALGGTTLSMKAGKVDMTSAQAQLHLTDTGDITAAGPTATISMTSDGDISITGPVGSATIGKDGAIEIKNSTGSLVITNAGKVELKGTIGGIVELFQEFAQTLATDTFAGFGAPAGQAAKYLEISQKLLALKA